MPCNAPCIYKQRNEFRNVQSKEFEISASVVLKCAESACHGCGGGAVGDGGAFEGSSAVADEEDIVYLIGRSWSIWP